MAFKVRVHAYLGLKQILQRHGTQFASDSVKMLMEPYVWAWTGDSNLLVPIVMPPDSTVGVTCIRVEVAPAQAIRYEVNPSPGSVTERAAGVNSPLLTGIDVFDFHPGWGFQFIDATGTY